MRNSLLYTVYAPTFIIAFCRGVLAPILPLYASSFDISYGLIGIVLASQGIGNLLGDVPAGVIISRVGQKGAMLGGIGLLGVATLAMGWAQTAPELIGYGFVGGVGMALWNISRHSYITGATAVARRGRAIAVFGGVNRIGTFAGPAIGGLIAAAYTLRAPFLFCAVIILLTTLFPLFFAENIGSGSSKTHRGGLLGHAHHLTTLFREHRQILTTAGIGQLLAQMIRAGRVTIVPLFGADVLGLDVLQISWIVSLSSAIDMVLFPVAGYVMDRFGRKYAYVPSFAIQALGMALIPFSFGFSSLLAATLIIGFGNGLGSGTMMTLGADLAPDESTNEFLGIWRLVGDMGQTGGPIVVGTVADLLSLAPATFVIALAGLGAALTLGVFVPETLKRETVALHGPKNA